MRVGIPAHRLLTFLISLSSLLAASPSFAFDGCRAADFDGDGVVSEEDLTHIQGVLIEGFGEREDLDGDGFVTEADVLLVQRYARPCEDCPSIACNGCPADFDGSGLVDEEDREDLLRALGHDCRFNLNRDGLICPWDLRLFGAYLGSPEPLSVAAARADFDGNGQVNETDMYMLSSRIPENPEDWDRLCARDLNHDGIVGADDLWFLLAEWGSCPEENGHGERAQSKPDVCDTEDRFIF
ncbi:MAG: hypothetical protein K0U98_07720 [Deltaproteobacteria bacterium]|nr:hypothetical protein [Deltaproteobacteria bacterium]